MWTRAEVEQFIIDHPIDCSWKDGHQVPGSKRKNGVFSSPKTEDTGDYGPNAEHEIRLLPNLRYCPQHTLLDVLDFMQKAVGAGDVNLWNHPNGEIRIIFIESIDPGP